MYAARANYVLMVNQARWHKYDKSYTQLRIQYFGLRRLNTLNARAHRIHTYGILSLGILAVLIILIKEFYKTTVTMSMACFSFLLIDWI